MFVDESVDGNVVGCTGVEGADGVEVGGVDGDEDGAVDGDADVDEGASCLLYTSPSPRDRQKSRMPSSA